MSHDNEPSQQDIIEAQLHLLLAGRDHLDVTRALQNVLHKHQKQIAVMPFEDMNIIDTNMQQAQRSLEYMRGILNGSGLYSGTTIVDMLRAVTETTSLSITHVTLARNQLAHSTYEARKYAYVT